MLFYLFRFLEQFDIPGAHMWSYISFRALLTLILSLIVSAWFGEKFIKYMKRRKFYETARDASIDPFSKRQKEGPDKEQGLWRKEKGSTHDGRYHYHGFHLGSRIIARKNAKHLLIADDRNYRLVGILGVFGRLHQNI